MTDDITDLDARLSAYLDGELSPEESAEIDAMIASDDVVAGRLEALAMAKADFEEAASDIDDVEMSPGLSDLLERLETEQAAPDPDTNVIGFPLWRRASAFVQEHRAVAASVVVATGLMAAQTALPAQVASVEGLTGSGTIYADSKLGSVLEASASGTLEVVGDGLSATPRFTFASDDTFCRVIDVTSDTSNGRLVACRAETAWRVAIATFGEVEGNAPDAPYRTASAAGAESIETFLDAAMSGAPFGRDDEAQLLKSGWTKPAAPKE